MMWKIEKPDIKKACGKDIKELVEHCENLDDTIKPQLKKLYKEYDSQNGYVTSEQLNQISTEKGTVIHSQYKKTYDGDTLSYIRAELMDGVFKCPYCSINQPATLDHYMPESKFGALAVCRMNLVPMCGTCNNRKLDKQYDKFIHCYYQKFPEDEPFLKAKVYVLKNRFVIRLYIEESVLTAPGLKDKVLYQIKELKLFQKIIKESSVFVSTLCKDFDCGDNAGMKQWLQRKLNTCIEIYGYNDWRCAILRGMMEYPKLDISVFQYNKVNSPTRYR